jgi:hypothetical protein
VEQELKIGANDAFHTFLNAKSHPKKVMYTRKGERARARRGQEGEQVKRRQLSLIHLR